MAVNLNEINTNQLLLEYDRELLKQSELLQKYGKYPPEVKRRLNALKNLQFQITDINVELNKEVCKLEKVFESKYQEIFAKRNEIINGRYEPTDEECNLPSTYLELDQALQNLNMNSINENTLSSAHQVIKGIPNFWFTIFKYFPMLEPFVQEYDEPILKHLTDVQSISTTEPTLSFTLEFYFSPNEYFSNRVLTKEYFLKCIPDPDDYFSFDGPEIYKCVGCEINWYEGKNCTKRNVEKKLACAAVIPGNDDSRSSMMEIKSFFNFFNPPITLNENDPHFDEINYHLQKDFEIGQYLKERVIPRAVLCFTGETEEFLANESSTDSESESNGGGSEIEQQIN